MTATVRGQQSLKNFYQSVQFSHSALAALMMEDVLDVTLYSLGGDKATGQVAAERLRQKSSDLPVVLQRVLESALTELGYS